MGAVPKSLGTPEYEMLRGRLAELRHGAGLSQRALAAKMRVSPSWIAKVESGERRVDLVEFCWFCQALDLDPAETAAKVVRSMTGRKTPTRRRPRRRRA